MAISACTSGGGGGGGGGASSAGGGTLQSIALTATNTTFHLGFSEQITATGTYSDGTSVDITNSVTWSSEFPAMMDMDPGTAGNVISKTTGTAIITATDTATGVSGTLSMTVSPALLQSIALSPVSASVPKGVQQQYTATGTFSDATTADITTQLGWTTGNGSVASPNAVAGLIDAVGAGTTTVTATDAGTGVTATVNITVTTPVVTLVSVSPASTNVPNGTTKQLTATATYNNGTTLPVTSLAAWSSSNGATASIDPATGLATGNALGAVTITATFGGVSGTAGLTVTAALLNAITISPTPTSVVKGLTKQFSALGSFTDGSSQDITASVVWSSSDTAVATILTGGANTGLATGVAAGSVTIFAVDSATLVQGTAALTVNPVVLQSITVTTPNPYSVAKGLTKQFTANGNYSDGSQGVLTTGLTWSSSAPAIASVDTAGLVTGAAQGTAAITVTDNATGISGTSATLTVTAAVLTSITVVPSVTSVANGLTSQFSANGNYSDNTQTVLTTGLTWSSANTATAIVDGAGLATGKGVGTVTITAKDNATLISGTASLTVTSAVLQSISVSPNPVTMAKGLTQQFAASGTYSDGSTVPVTGSVTWSSSDNLVAPVDAAGLATAAGVGSATITAAWGAVSGTAIMNVTAPTLTSVTVTPVAPSLPIGLTLQFSATGTYSDSTTQDLTGAVNWTSGTPGVATISAAGLASSAANGTSTITATHPGGLTGSTVLTVTNDTLASIVVTPATVTILPRGAAQQLTATGTYIPSNIQADITNQVVWTTSAPLTANVSSTGMVTAVANGAGTATITATKGAVFASSTVNVVAASLQTLTVTPNPVNLPAGLIQQYKVIGTLTDGTQADYTASAAWASTNTAAATIVAGGKATLLAAGSGSIKATVVDPNTGTIVGSSLLTVTAATLNSIAVTAAKTSLPAGVKQQYTATGSYSDGSFVEITGSVTWASNNAAAATITTGGLASAIATGSANITATKGAVVGTSGLTVTAGVISSIVVTKGVYARGAPAGADMYASDTLQLTATGTFTDGSVVDITDVSTWASNLATTASMAATGIATGTYVGTGTGVASPANITAQFGAVTSPALVLTVKSLILEGTAGVPKDLTGLLPYPGQAYDGNQGNSSYYTILGTPGQLYTVFMTNFTTTARVRLYDGINGTKVCDFSSVVQGDIVCFIAPATGVISMRVREAPNANKPGALFTITVQ